MMFGRKLAVEYTEFFRKYVPGCEEIELLTTAPVMGVRDTRRIVGEFELTIEDFKSARQFPDQVAVYNRPTDVHPTDTSEKEFKRFLDDFEGFHGLGEGDCLGVPYGILVPKGWKNLWVAGRCHSSDTKVHGSIRAQSAAYMMGQAVGHRRRAVDPHRPAGVRSRYLDAGGNAARAGRVSAAGQAQPRDDARLNRNISSRNARPALWKRPANTRIHRARPVRNARRTPHPVFRRA